MNNTIVRKNFKMKTFLLLLNLLVITTFNFYAQGFVETYPQEPNAVISDNYKVFVNEKPVLVYSVGETKDVAYCHFAFAGKITVRIQVSEVVNNYNLSPHSYGIISKNLGNNITFELDKPRKLLLKEVNKLVEHLCIFADPPQDNAPIIDGTNVISILDKGADNTGTTDNLSIIQNALDKLPSGGVLYFPAGRYTAGGDIVMKSDRSIYLSAGATIQASLENELRVNFSKANNVKLFGRGSIDGCGDRFRANYKNAEGKVIEAGKTILYCNESSNNCTIEGVVVKNAITWTSIVMYTKNWNVYNLKIVNGRKYTNHDCWDPHDAVNMMVDDCFLYGTDDAIAYSVLSPNLDLNTTFRNSTFFNGHMGTTVRIGPWVGENTKNITVENNDHLLGGNNDNTLGFYLGGSISNLRYLNNRIENAQFGTILIRTFWDDHYAGKAKSGSLENLVFDRLYIEYPSIGWNGHFGRFEGENPANFVKNITFKDFYQQGVLQTSEKTADIEIVGKYVSNVQFTTSTTPLVDINATTLIASKSNKLQGKFTVTRSGGSIAEPLKVNYTIRGTAVNGTDYTAINKYVVIPAGSASADIVISQNPNNNNTSYKTVLLSIESRKSSYIIGANYHAMVTVANIDDIKATTTQSNLFYSSQK